MKPRQRKKNSKSAMDLLIKVLGFKQHDFYLETNDKTEISQWVLVYSGSSESYAQHALSNQLFYKTSKWVEVESSGWSSKQPFGGLNLNGVKLISYCRKLAKAGVKFR